MTKKLDWNAIASVNFDDKRRKSAGILTGKEAFAKAYDKLAKAEEALAHRQQVEPILRKALFEHMVTRRPITVVNPIHNPTETLGGLAKGEEDDGFYYNSASRSAEAAASAKFEEVMETIPPGTELIFKSWDKAMGQYIFKGSNGQEYAIFEKSVIIFKGSSMENPGLYGLLFNTDLVSILGEE
jgi:hypothetical protein